MSDVSTIYKKRIETFSTKLKEAKGRSSLLSTIRLWVFVATLVGLIGFMRAQLPQLGLLSLIVGVVIFIILVICHERVTALISNLTNLLHINERCLGRVEDRWSGFSDTGEEFKDDAHQYSSDLDIFGTSSLFQYINTAYTVNGRETVAQRLSCSPLESSEIKEVQQAVHELRPKIEFRHNFEASAMSIEHETPEKILSWVEEETAFSFSKKKILIFKFLPIVSFLVLIVSSLFLQSIALPALFYFVQILIFGLYAKRSLSLFTVFDKQIKAVSIYAELIKQIESEEWQTEHLQSQKAKLVNSQGNSASVALHKIKAIIEKAGLRFNPLVHFFVNCITLWDIHCAVAALKWKRENSSSLKEWLSVIAEFETISSLAQLAFDHPAWTMPEVTSEMSIKADEVQHPLIPEAESVSNSITIDEESRIVIITGSNMSGKSTFLRTIATNMVLAYAGSAVASTSFSCGQFELITSLRNSDAVAKKMSTFYTELVRIKEMIDLIREGKPTFFLIDEIFNGTNSHDRIDGAFVVLRELHKQNSLGMLSTHDLELCSLSTEDDFNFTNYHFREEYADNKLHFDYKMYDGKSNTRNAIALMDIVGIPTDGLKIHE